MRAFKPVLAAMVLATGCVSTTTLQPLPSTPTTRAGAPLAEDAGVRLVANGKAWKGQPALLGRLVTPVEVRLENQGLRPLRIALGDFSLVGTSRFEYAALTPSQLSRGDTAAGVGGGVGEGVGGSGAVGADGTPPAEPPPLGGRAVAPGSGWGTGFYGPGWMVPFEDPFYGPNAFYGYAPEPLPTEDMMKAALPEGTLEPGGALTGFLYFQNVGEREGQVTLSARLVDARTGEQFGTLAIPFNVQP